MLSHMPMLSNAFTNLLTLSHRTNGARLSKAPDVTGGPTLQPSTAADNPDRLPKLLVQTSKSLIHIVQSSSKLVLASLSSRRYYER